MEIHAEDEFNDIRWEDEHLIKLRTEPNLEVFQDKYYQTETFIFSGNLILFLVDKDIEIRETKIVQFDLNTFEIKLIKILDNSYSPTFYLIDNETLKITYRTENKIIELILHSEKKYSH